MTTVIYHAPFPLDFHSNTASGVRPVHMFRAFQENGLDVIDLTGNASQRSKKIQALRRKLNDGLHADFLYSESVTIPTMFSEPRHLPPHPFLDPALFRLCNAHSIPTSLFYRDIYWRFPNYRKTVGPVISSIMQHVYKYDLSWYSRYVDRLYIPSSEMAPLIPHYPQERMRALPPGCHIVNPDDLNTRQEPVRLLYVGSIADHYHFEEALQAIAGRPGVHLTLCCRQDQWNELKDYYAPFLADNIDVVHESGEGLERLYEQTDVCFLYMKPEPYREFASPLKLYEYIGHGRPIIASTGTHVGQFVREQQCGWTQPYGKNELVKLLDHLVASPQEIARMSDHVKRVRSEHTWKARAQQVAQDLLEK